MRERSILTLGKFDGLHLGHRAILRRLVERSRLSQARSVALVLHPDPVQLLHGRSVPLLSTVEDRIRGIRELGVDHAELLPFTPAQAGVEPVAFVRDLRDNWSLSGLVVGDDFAFGRGRAGTVSLLQRLGSEWGFEVDVVAALPMRDGRVSSQAIRNLVGEGQVAEARALLGTDFSLVGRVVHGAKRGRQLGYPTANLQLAADYVVPVNGVYAVWARPEAQGRLSGPAGDAPWFMGAANIGIRPQFGGSERSIEVHLLDFTGDLYGSLLRVAFAARLRDEARFPDLAGLLAQMARDVADSRQVLELQGTPK